ncbi:hypothetical protein D3C81_1241370 [compost metagenome]
MLQQAAIVAVHIGQAGAEQDRQAEQGQHADRRAGDSAAVASQAWAGQGLVSWQQAGEQVGDERALRRKAAARSAAGGEVQATPLRRALEGVVFQHQGHQVVQAGPEPDQAVDERPDGVAPLGVALFAQHAHAQGLQTLHDRVIELIEAGTGGRADGGIGRQAMAKRALEHPARQCRAECLTARQLLQPGDHQVDGHLYLQVFQRLVGKATQAHGNGAYRVWLLQQGIGTYAHHQAVQRQPVAVVGQQLQGLVPQAALQALVWLTDQAPMAFDGDHGLEEPPAPMGGVVFALALRRWERRHLAGAGEQGCDLALLVADEQQPRRAIQRVTAAGHVG